MFRLSVSKQVVIYEVKRFKNKNYSDTVPGIVTLLREMTFRYGEFKLIW